ncbi:MAG: hypothetical protein RLZZ602_580, partial [Pseudomonadota bacterium]
PQGLGMGSSNLRWDIMQFLDQNVPC